MGFHAFQNCIEVVGIHFDEFPLFELGQRLLRLAGEIAEYPNDKGQLLQFDCAADFDVVGNLHAGGTHPVQFVLCALSSHKISLLGFLR